jgi:uncharacterized protein YggE
MRFLFPAILMLVSTTLYGQTEQPPEISAEGHGEVSVTPDEATVIISVETRSATATEAAEENARRVRAVLDALEDMGLGGDDVVTSGYTVAPDWKRDREENRELIGYMARNTVRVRLDEMDQIGRVIDASLGAGANRIESVRFDVSDTEEPTREALAAAVEQAQSLGLAMAEAAGGGLGSLIELRMQEVLPSRAYRTEMIAQQATTPIMPGEVTVTATVRARWVFRQGN